MKYLKYISYAAVIGVCVYLPLALISSHEYGKQIALITFPLGIWTGRLIVAKRRGIITRRIPKIDGGKVMEGVFWSFRPDVYERKPGFDNFKGYFFGEAMYCSLLWLMFLSISVLKTLKDMGFDV